MIISQTQDIFSSKSLSQWQEEMNKEIQLLHFEHSSHSATTLHSHPYCQLEYCMGSPMRIFDGENNKVFPPGSAWFIPPDTPHQFLNTENQNFLSLKFRTPSPPREQMTQDRVITFLLDEICRRIDTQAPFSTHSSEGHFLIIHYLSGIIERLAELTFLPVPSGFDARFYAAVCHRGAQLSVEELAEHFNMSRAQFKYAFYKEYGKSDIKGTISRYLIELAQRELLYSDKPLFRIAEQLHFSSIYAFSRFFKQHCGVSPLTFRKQQGQE